MLKSIYFALILCVAGWALSACNLPIRLVQNQSAISTSAAQTVQAVLSSAATATPGQPLASPPPLTPTATEPGCKDNASYTAWTRNNVLYDAKEAKKPLAANSSFKMSWTLKNTGTCTWNQEYRMAFESGAPLTKDNSYPVIQPGKQIEPGQSITIVLQMTAPAQSGDYQSTYQLDNGHGKAAITLGVLTTVGTPSSQAPSGPGNLGYTYDCTSGSVNITLNWVDRASGESGYRISRDGTQVAELGAGATSYTETVASTGTYVYTVSAFNSSSQASASVTVRTTNCH